MRWDGSSLLAAATLLSACSSTCGCSTSTRTAEDDRRLHPQRVLQRGLVTLRDLQDRRRRGHRARGGARRGLRGRAAFLGWLVAFGFSLLMLAEFFAGRWLRGTCSSTPRAHMLVMPLLALVLFSFATGRPPLARRRAGSGSTPGSASSSPSTGRCRARSARRRTSGRECESYTRTLRHLRRRLGGARGSAWWTPRWWPRSAGISACRRGSIWRWWRSSPSAWSASCSTGARRRRHARSGWRPTPACTSSPSISCSRWRWRTASAWSSSRGAA